MESFPSLSETYILWHMAELVRSGNELTILPAAAGVGTQVQPEVHELSLLDRTHALPTIPAEGPRRLTFAAGTVLAAFRREPKGAARLATKLGRQLERKGSLQVFSHLAFYDGPSDFDVLQAYFGPSGRRGELLRASGAVRGALVVSFLGFDLNVLGQRHGGGFYSRVFRRADVLTASSDFMRQKLVDLGAPADRLVKLPLGLPLRKFPFRERALATGEPLRAVMVGRLAEVKGVEYGLEGIAETRKLGVDVTLDVIGDGPLRAKLEDLNKTLDLGAAVTFHGARPAGYVREYLSRAHVCLYSGVRARDGAEEALGGAVLEAQAVGLPVIATSVGGVAEGMIDGRSGILVPARDPRAIARAFAEIFERRAEWPEMGRAGRAHIAERYDSEALNVSWLELYSRLGRSTGRC